jgi:hypothetical protein
VNVNSGIGGAKRAGALPDSKLAKLIEEQEKQISQLHDFSCGGDDNDMLHFSRKPG